MMQGVGVEPTRISPAELKSATLTTRSTLLEASIKTFSKFLHQLTMLGIGY
jgi:hypothetical protein